MDTKTTKSTELSAINLLKMYNLTDEDLWKVRQFGEHASSQIDLYLERFYTWMRETLPDVYAQQFHDQATETRAKNAQKGAWERFWNAKIDDEYIESRIKIGKVHAQLQVEPRHYMAAMSQSFILWTTELYDNKLSDEDYQAAVYAITRLMNLETALVLDVYSRQTTNIIMEQSRALVEMSTPIASLADRVLMLPIVGIIDSNRAQNIMERMLEKIMETQARAFILDISGVAVVDTAVANHLIHMTQASHLMGCEAIVSGLSPKVAQTIVDLGIDVGEMKTTGNLKDALHIAFNLASESYVANDLPDEST